MSINTKADFDAIIERIRTLVENYENNVLHYNKYQFYLANGDRISFEVALQYIGHLLGIRLDYLRSTNLFKNQDSYGLLKEFLDSSYSVYQNVQAGHLSYKFIFSDYLEEKLDAFEQLIYYCYPDEIEFVCKYEKDKIFQQGFKKNYLCDYFIAKKLNNGDIYLLGLAQSADKYCPMTSLVFRNDENQQVNLDQLLVNQTLTMANTIAIYNPVNFYQSNFHMNLATSLKHINLLNEYKRYTSGVSIDTSSHHQFTIKTNMYKDRKISSYKIMCQQLTKAIGNHEIFSLEQIDDTMVEQLDEEIIQLVQTYNNEICQDVSNTSAQTTYTDLLEQYKSIASQVNLLKQQLEQSQLQATTYYEQIQSLERENESYKAFQQQIFEAVEAQKRK